jgi:CBS domain-containing protein
MPIGEVAVRQVVIAPRGTSILDASRLMREYHVGDIVITGEANGKRCPVGIVTDRDIVLEVLAQGIDPSKLSVDDIMSEDVITVEESEGIFQTIQLMRAKGARRVPVVDKQGTLVGIVSADDFLDLLAQELNELAKLISREQKREAEVRR